MLRPLFSVGYFIWQNHLHHVLFCNSCSESPPTPYKMTGSWHSCSLLAQESIQSARVSCRSSELAPPTHSPPPPRSMWGTHSLVMEGGGGAIQTKGQTLWYSVLWLHVNVLRNCVFLKGYTDPKERLGGTPCLGMFRNGLEHITVSLTAL
jgi:hypothetical protein